jgi:hypothetical protein
MTRTRINESFMPTGIRTRFGGPASSFLVPTVRERCSDEPGLGDCMPFDVSRETHVGGILHSHQDNGYWTSTFINYPVDAHVNGQLGLNLTYPGAKPDSYYATQAVARTNPSRPYVDVPVSVFELGDIVTILQSAGKTLAQQIGGNNLKFQFGIKPLVEDLFKLTEFHDQVSRRIKELERLKSARGLRRTVQLDQLAHNDVLDVVWQSSDAFIRTNTNRLSTQKIWGHVRWTPDVDFSSIPEAVELAWVKRAVLGMTIDFATLWEATPWSWLIDWGFALGDFLKAQRNIIPATCSGVSLMRHTKSTIAIPEVEYHGLHKMSAGQVVYERKERYSAPVAPTAHFPFLSGNQMGIVASLAVTRR